MKLLILLPAFIILLASVSAISTDLKDSYQPLETMLVKVSANVAGQIDPTQVYFKRNNIFVAVEYDVVRVGNDWYIWAVAPSAANNYTLRIEDVMVTSGSGTALEDYEKSFSVSGEQKSYTIKPGAIVTSSDFDIEAIVNGDSAADIDVDFPSSRSVTLQPGANTISFGISTVASTSLRTMHVGDYIVPAYIVIAGTTPQTEQNASAQNATNSTSSAANSTSNSTSSSAIYPKIKVSPAYVQKFMYKSSIERTYEFTAINENNITNKNLALIYNKTLFEIEDDSFTLKANQNHTFEVVLKEGLDHDIKEKIYLNGTNVSIEIPFFVRFTDNASEIANFYGENYRNSSLNQTMRRTSYLCSELGGAVCSGESTCNGEALQSKDGNCCIGVCQQPEGKSYAWVGWIIAFAVLGAGWFAYYKYKKVGTQ